MDGSSAELGGVRLLAVAVGGSGSGAGKERLHVLKLRDGMEVRPHAPALKLPFHAPTREIELGLWDQFYNIPRNYLLSRSAVVTSTDFATQHMIFPIYG